MKPTALLAAAAFSLITTLPALAACSDPAGPKVDWSGGCDLSGQNLSGARLKYADLLGANLTGADLTGADLTNATLDEANLTNAILTNANLTNANLYNATWVDGRKCGASSTTVSIGGCSY